MHAADSLRGPLTVSFSASKDNAKFDLIRILDASGREVARAEPGALKAQRDGVDPALIAIPAVPGPELWKDAAKSPVERATDMARRLSVAEKIAQIRMTAPAVPRLGIPAYDWWNEALHGVARVKEHTTVFPQAIGLAATWDPALHREVAGVIGDEARALNRPYAARTGATARYYGLDVWSPNVNIFRDPRWGRGQETYGEDPYLTGRLGVAFVQGLQGGDPVRLKIAATPKHFAVHSGPRNCVMVSTPKFRLRIFGKRICRLRSLLCRRQGGVGDGRVQPRERRIRLVGQAVASGYSPGEVGL